MAYVIEQSLNDYDAAGTSNNLVITTTPSSGNLLIAIIGIDKDGGTVTVEAGWETAVVIKADVSSTLAYSYKISDGTEAGVRFSHTVSRASVMIFMEISGLTASPYDTAASANSGASAVTSQSTGTTATTAQADSLAIAMWSSDTASNVETGRTYTNSFVEQDFVITGSSPGVSAALKTLSSTGTVECTFDTTDTGDQQCGAMAIFKIAAVGGGATGKSNPLMGCFGGSLFGPIG